MYLYDIRDEVRVLLLELAGQLEDVLGVLLGHLLSVVAGILHLGEHQFKDREHF